MCDDKDIRVGCGKKECGRFGKCNHSKIHEANFICDLEITKCGICKKCKFIEDEEMEI